MCVCVCVCVCGKAHLGIKLKLGVLDDVTLLLLDQLGSRWDASSIAPHLDKALMDFLVSDVGSLSSCLE